MKKNKDYYVQWLLKIINPLTGFYSSEKALLHIGHTSTHYEDKTIPMEAFSRVLWGLVPLWRGGENNEKFEEIYKCGIVAGTSPANDEYWGGCRDYDQKFVEMTALSYAILMTPEKVWDPLNEKEKDNLVQWLNQINNYKCSDSNWQFFCILTNVALKSVGAKYAEDMMQKCLEKIESYYAGNGWYKDGLHGEKDYYVAFAFQFYSIVYSMFMDKEDPERCMKFRERAMKFGRDFVFWFSSEGSAVPFGRSATYRFAQVAFFSICVVAGIEVFSLPIMKGIIERHLDYWMKQPIFDNAGILAIGYAYPNLIMSEGYNAPGSPYWALKSFAFLALPADHIFWKVESETLPEVEEVKYIENADIIIQHSKENVILFPPGMKSKHLQPNYEEKYSKFAYSSKFGFSVSRSQRNVEESAPDSMLAFQICEHIYVKGMINSYEIEENDRIRIRWSPLSGIDVETIIIIKKDEHERIHEIDSKYDCMAYECGFSIPIDVFNPMKINEDDKTAEVYGSLSFCKVETISGNGYGRVIESSPNTNLLYSKTVIPSINYIIKKGKNKIQTRIRC